MRYLIGKKVKIYMIAEQGRGKNKRVVWRKKLHDITMNIPNVTFDFPSWINKPKEVTVVFEAEIKDKRNMALISEDGDCFPGCRRSL